MGRKKEKLPPPPPANKLAKLVLDCSYRHRPESLFRWALAAILKGFGAPREDLPPEDAREEVGEIIRAYFDTVRHEAPFKDVLGPLYMELASHGCRQALGQFFTPQNVADMMAEMNLHANQPKPRGEGLIRVADPACGSGVMMLSMMRVVMKHSGSDALLGWSFTGIDLDRICADMFAVQGLTNMAVHNINLGEFCVYRGDSLSQSAGLETVVYATYGGDLHDMKVTSRKAARHAEQHAGQMDLFELVA